MANMSLNIEQRLGQKLTNEQLILWNSISNIIDIDCIITSIYFEGVLAGSDLNTYAANKLFVAYEYTISGGSGGVTPLNVQTYNELNAQKGQFANSFPYWDATAAAVRYGAPNSIALFNQWFSRVVATGTFIKFIGYRIIF